MFNGFMKWLVPKLEDWCEKKQAPLTVIFRGPWRRDWGFWKYEAVSNKHTWELWSTYLGVPYTRARE